MSSAVPFLALLQLFWTAVMATVLISVAPSETVLDNFRTDLFDTLSNTGDSALLFLSYR